MKRKGIIGSKIGQRKKIKRRIRKIEYLSNVARTCEKCGGRREKKTFEPSRGGIGMRLKIARVMFMATIYAEMTRKGGDAISEPKRITNPNTRAIRIFAPGPAREMRSSPTRRFFTL